MIKMQVPFEQVREGRRLFVIDKLSETGEHIFSKDFKVYLKRDGTSTMIKDNVMYKRYDANARKGREVPEGAILCQDEPGPTGSFPVWVKTDRNNPDDRFHYEAFDKQDKWSDGTYELCGEKINGNHENLEGHILISHLSEPIELEDVSFDGIKSYLEDNYIEGLIFKTTDTGEYAKIRRRDFGLKWGNQ